VWTLVYELYIQNYSQISIPRSSSNSKRHHAFSLDLGLKCVKLARKIMKVVVRTCLQMRHPNLFSNLNCGKLVKVENRPSVFPRLGLKGCEIRSERHESWRAHLSTNGTSKSMLNFQFREFGQNRNSIVRFPSTWA
jgi:hypothetical protein